MDTIKRTDVVSIRLRSGETVLCNVVEWRVSAKESFIAQMAIRVENVGTLRPLMNPKNPKQVGYSLIGWMVEQTDIAIRDILSCGKASENAEAYHVETFRKVAIATPQQAKALAEVPAAANAGGGSSN